MRVRVVVESKEEVPGAHGGEQQAEARIQGGEGEEGGSKSGRGLVYIFTTAPLLCSRFVGYFLICFCMGRGGIGSEEEESDLIILKK